MRGGHSKNLYLKNIPGLRCFLLFILFLSGFVLPFKTLAQTSTVPKDSTKKHYKDSIRRQVDAIDIVRNLFGMKQLKPDTTPLKAHKVYSSVLPSPGYTLQTGFAGIVAMNFSFYNSDPKQTYISAINSSINYSQYHQFNIPILSTIWLDNNKVNLTGDYRYYVYPSITYGLGGHTNLSDADKMNYHYIRIYQIVSRQIVPNLLGGLGYNLDYHWDIQDIGYEKGNETDFHRYRVATNSLSSTSRSSGISFNLLYDTRKNVNNPVPKSAYVNLIYRPNFTEMGSDKNWQSLLLDMRKYVSVPSRHFPNNILAFWGIAWAVLKGDPPYHDLPTTAWDTYENSGRGYAQDRFKGKKFFYLESEYRFGILRNGLIGGVVFANAQAVSEWPSNQINTFAPAAGGGLRFKINKSSNINFAVDYGVGIRGSRGFFFNLGEVF